MHCYHTISYRRYFLTGNIKMKTVHCGQDALLVANLNTYFKKGRLPFVMLIGESKVISVLSLHEIGKRTQYFQIPFTSA